RVEPRNIAPDARRKQDQPDLSRNPEVVSGPRFCVDGLLPEFLVVAESLDERLRRLGRRTWSQPQDHPPDQLHAPGLFEPQPCGQFFFGTGPPCFEVGLQAVSAHEQSEGSLVVLVAAVSLPCYRVLGQRQLETGESYASR